MLAGDRLAPPFSLYSDMNRSAYQEPVTTVSDFFSLHTKMTDYKEGGGGGAAVEEKQVGEVS